MVNGIKEVRNEGTRSRPKEAGRTPSYNGASAARKPRLFAAPRAIVLGLSLLALRPVTARGQNAYVANNYDHTISVINTATDKVTATIPAGQQPWGMALTPDGQKLFVTNHRTGRIGVSSEVTVIDTATNAIIATIPLTNTSGGANGVAIAPDGGTVYVASGTNADSDGNTVTSIDASTNEITATTRIPPDPGSGHSYPYALALSPDGEKLYVTHRYGDGITVLDTAGMRVEDTIILRAGRQYASAPGTIAVAPDGSRIYVGSSYGRSLSVIDAATRAFSFPDTIPLSIPLAALAMTPDGSRLLIATEKLDLGYAFDTKTETLINSGGISPNAKTLYLGSAPGAIAVTSDGRKAYVTNQGSNSVTVIDVAKNAVIGTIAVGKHPIGIAIQKAPDRPSALSTSPAAKANRNP
jgi:YVTN family beta-propeller protein